MRTKLSLILILVALSVIGQPLSESFGITSHPWFGGGEDKDVRAKPLTINGMDIFDANGNKVSTLSAIGGFKVHRLFIGNDIPTRTEKGVNTGNMDMRFEPTAQKYFLDSYFQTAKQSGIDIVWSTQGSFGWYNTQGKLGKVVPIKPGADLMVEKNWGDYGTLCKQVAIRYATDTQDKIHLARVYNGYGNNWGGMLTNEKKAGLGTVKYIGGINEYDFLPAWSGAAYEVTPEQIAVSFKVLYDSTRSVSNEIQIIAPSSISPSIEKQIRFLVKLKQIYEAQGGNMPRDFLLDFHWYMRDGSTSQGAGTMGITPETAKAWEHAKAMDALVEEWGLLGWVCTETGWNTSTSTDPAEKKQRAPLLQGYTLEQSQGILMWRLALIFNASKHCKFVTFWHCRDNYDRGAYLKGGVNYENWQPKQSRQICYDAISRYGQYEATSFKEENGIYYASLNNGQVLGWTNLVNSGTVTPMPSVVSIAPPTEPEPEVPPVVVPAVFQLKYSKRALKDSSLVFEDVSTITPGIYYVYSTTTTTTEFVVKKDGQLLFSRVEGQAPYDMNGTANLTTGEGKPYEFKTGVYQITVTSAGQSKQWTINVQQVIVVPPPQPQYPVNDSYWKDGKIYFITPNGKYSIPATYEP